MNFTFSPGLIVIFVTSLVLQDEPKKAIKIRKRKYFTAINWVDFSTGLLSYLPINKENKLCRER
jgi:hypothetical protein